MSGIHARNAAIAAVLLVLVAAVPLGAHDEGILKAKPTTAAPGDTLRLEGSKMEAGSEYGLRMVGALQTYRLGKARADSAGTFAVGVVVPAGARPGTYRVEALAPDGDVAGKANVTVSSADPDSPVAAGDRARADDIVVRRDRGGLGWGVIGLVVGLSAGLGLGLLARSRRPTSR